jgi:hypothetical protein
VVTIARVVVPLEEAWEEVKGRKTVCGMTISALRLAVKASKNVRSNLKRRAQESHGV